MRAAGSGLDIEGLSKQKSSYKQARSEVLANAEYILEPGVAACS